MVLRVSDAAEGPLPREVLAPVITPVGAALVLPLGLVAAFRARRRIVAGRA